MYAPTDDTIIALATPPGEGALGIIRLSGKESIPIADRFFPSKNLTEVKSHTLHFGSFTNHQDEIVDEVVLSIFHNPRSYTGEDVIEISCHGSSYIIQQIIEICIGAGARLARPGEFTLRAFLNGKMDLSQAEAVADLIASESAASHQLAMQQMRGGFSNEIDKLREELLNFASLIELELDFSEEDVEFADRKAFQELITKITHVIKRLIDSFAIGNVLKNGIPVAIVGEPNVGKSTLLNALLNEDRAIVSDIAGTTRDTIEDEITIGGVGFRFIDTAGIRETSDSIEGLGIQKTFQKIEQAQVVIYLFDAEKFAESAAALKLEIETIRNKYPQKNLIKVANKTDRLTESQLKSLQSEIDNLLLLSAKKGIGIENLQNRLLEFVNTGVLQSNETVITNSRHYDALVKALEELNKVQHEIGRAHV